MPLRVCRVQYEFSTVTDPTVHVVSGGGPLSDSSFMGETLPNHGYVDLSLVGDTLDGSDSVQCQTDLATCCSYGV